MTLERGGVRGALVGVMDAMGLVATVDWGLTATQAHAVKLERLTIAVAPLGWDTTFTWLAQFLAVCRRSKVVAMSPESIAETAVFAGDEPCWGEAICYATARFNALQSTIN
jgi:hypothetical protein